MTQIDGALMTVPRGGWSLESFSGPHGRFVLALHGSHAQGNPVRAGLIVHCSIDCALQQHVVSQCCSPLWAFLVTDLYGHSLGVTSCPFQSRTTMPCEHGARRTPRPA